jgi:hypothetical protein
MAAPPLAVNALPSKGPKLKDRQAARTHVSINLIIGPVSGMAFVMCHHSATGPKTCQARKFRLDRDTGTG